MKRFIRISGYFFIVIFFGVALSGCKKNTQEDPKAKEIIVWSFEDEDVWKPIAKTFATKYKGYKITYEKQVLDSTYENRALNAILSGQGPDVWNMPNDWVYRHREKLVSNSKKGVNIDHFSRSVVESVVFNDEVYALSSYSEPLMVYYNPEIFQETLNRIEDENRGSENSDIRKEASRLLKSVPLTWTDFSQTVNLLTQKSTEGEIELSGIAMGTDKIANSSDILYLLMIQNETKILSDDLKQAVFNLPAGTPKDTSDVPGLRAIEFYTSFADSGSDNYSWDDSLGDEIEGFTNGKVAMIFGYSSLQNYFLQKYPNFKYRKAPVPQLTGDSSKIVDYARFNAFGVVKASTEKYGREKLATCWELINLIADGSSTHGFNSALKVHSSEKSSTEVDLDARKTNNPENISLVTAKSLIKGRYPAEFDRIVRASIAMINDGTQDPETALEAAARDINVLLRKEKW